MNPLSSSFTPSQASTSALNPEAALFEPVESPCQTPTLHSPAGCTPSERKSSAPSTPTLNQEQRGHLLAESIQQQQILRVCRACIDGQLGSLQTIIQPGSPSAFELVNSAHPHTGLLPLHYAASRGYLHIVSYLLEQGAMLLEDPSGETPLHVAAYKGHAVVLECLISSASDSNAVNAADSDGWQPLHNACSRGWLDIVQMLVANGALPDQESNLGYTPLMNAASKGHLPIINFLISKGLADPFKRNKNGEAAYDTASASEPFVCEVLAAYEAKLWEKRMSEVPEADALPYSKYLQSLFDAI